MISCPRFDMNVDNLSCRGCYYWKKGECMYRVLHNPLHVNKNTLRGRKNGSKL